MPGFTIVPSQRKPSRVFRPILNRGRKLGGVAVGQWRYRVGDYGIRYDIKGPVVYLHVVRHRKEVYR